MKDTNKQSQATGIVVSCSRRNAMVLVPPHALLPARIGSKVLDIVVGDRVKLSREHEHHIIVEVEERTNCLSRTLGPKTKNIVVNLDRLLLVTAVEPLFNTSFVDRVLVVCFLRDIPVTLIVNKCDLGTEETDHLIAAYASVGIDLLLTSALEENGLRYLRPLLDDADLHSIALAGVSGVGKSSILNALIPDAEQRTGSVSWKTGKGTQTTSMAQGYLYTRDHCDDLLIVDLPGIQHFGVSNLQYRQVAESYPEFVALAAGCEYADCRHIAEPACAVLEAVDSGEIAPSRYLSYLGIIDEIDAHKPY